MNFSNNFNELSQKASSLIEFYSTRNLHKNLQNASDYSLFSAGKRLRPVLTLATAKMLAVDEKKVAQVIVGIESLHVASLIHDDLPALDDDTLRRGRATCHIEHGEGMALLAGDSLIAQCFLLITKAEFLDDAEKTKLNELLSQTFIEICEGQAIDISSTKQKDAELLELCHKKKTASLICASVLAAFYLSDFRKEVEIEDTLKEYGTNLGLLFQITDDILDQTSSSKVLGKNAGSDHDRNAQTYVSVYGLDGARELAKKHAEIAILALEKLDFEAEFFIELTKSVLQREK